MGKSLPCQNAGVDHTLPHPSPGEKCAPPKLTVASGTTDGVGTLMAPGGSVPAPPPCCQFTPGAGETLSVETAGKNIRSWIMPGLGASCLVLKCRCRGSPGRWAASRNSRNLPSEVSATRLKVKSGCSEKLSNLCGGGS